MKQTRKQQKESTRKHIIEKAYEIYSAQGFAVSSKEMASYAEVSEGSLFAHFGVMQNLIENVIDNFGGQLTSRLHATADRHGSIVDFLCTHIDVLSEYESFYSRLVEEQAKLPHNAQVTFMCLQSAVSYHLNEVIQNSNDIKDIPPYIVFNCWIGLIHHYLLNRERFGADPNGSVLKRYKAVLIDSFIILITK